MKEVKHYPCDICGTEYNDKEKCKRCEKSHCTPKEIVKARYTGFCYNAKGYPVSITVKMEDGKEVIYKRWVND